MQPLNAADQTLLLQIARDALENSVRAVPLPPLRLEQLPPALQREGASFVTLTSAGRLRGCIGALQAYRPLAKDVRAHAMAAAFQDYRFTPVQPVELPQIAIEVSVLTPKQPLAYESSEDLVRKLRPGVDGVVLQEGDRRATFLPQVWEQLPGPSQFLSQLSLKMGASSDLWKKKPLQVFTYQVQKFHE